MLLIDRNSYFRHINAFALAIATTTPLFSNWISSVPTYIVFAIGVFSSIFLNIRTNFKISAIDIPLFLFFSFYLFSIFYAENSEFTTELLFIPILLFIYFGGKGIVENDIITLFLNYLTIIFLIFSCYLLLELSEVDFYYNAYYFYSDAHNKVDYLTTALYAGIVAIYISIGLHHVWLKLPLIIFTFFLIAISGARFSIFFFSTFLLILLLSNFKSIVMSKYSIIFFLTVLLSIQFIPEQIQKKEIEKINKLFDFSIMRLNHFNHSDTSLLEREEMIDKSLVAINKHPFLGYGIHSSPTVIKYPYPHNMFLETWLDTGIIGVLALSMIILIMLRILYFSRFDISLLSIGILNLYIILAHLKSFSILHSQLFFIFAGISVSSIIQYNKKIRNK